MRSSTALVLVSLVLLRCTPMTPPAALGSAASSLSPGPLLSPEFGMGPPVYVPADRERFGPLVASNGDGSLVVWTDMRTGAARVWATRLDATGTVLDPAGLTLGADEPYLSQLVAGVAWGGGSYLVTWSSTSGVDPGSIRAARVAPNGQILDPAGLHLADNISPGALQVASNGSSFLVTWLNASSQLLATRVSAAGAVLDATPIVLAANTNAKSLGGVASDGNQFLVTWAETRTGVAGDLYGARVSSAGQVLDPEGTALLTGPTDKWPQALVFGGGQYLLSWVEWPTGPGGSWVVRGARLNPTLSVLDPSGIDLSSTEGRNTRPSLAWNGSTFLVVYERNFWGGFNWEFQVIGVRVAPNGTVLDPAGFDLGTATVLEPGPVVAWTGSEHLVATQYSPRGLYNPDQIGATRLDLAGVPLSPWAPPSVISTAASIQYSPAVAWNGSAYFVSWSELAPYAANLGVRVSASGAVVDPAPTQVANSFGAASLASNGSDFLLALPTGAARVSSAGVPLDPQLLSLDGASSVADRATAWNGSSYLVAWASFSGDLVYASRVTDQGVVLDQTPLVVALATSASNVAVASNGSDFLVTWANVRPPGQLEVYAARVTAAGAALDSNGFLVGVGGNPAVGWDGADYVVAWCGNSGTASGVVAKRVNELGLALDPSPLLLSATSRFPTATELTCDGTACLVVWTDADGRGLSQVRGARLSPDGTVLDPGGVALTTQPADVLRVGIASSGPRRFLLVYEGLDQRPGIGVQRVLGRTIAFNVPPAGRDQLVTANEDVPKSIVLGGADADGDPVTFAVVAGPQHGTLSGVAPNLVYSPNLNFVGSDAFTFKVNDGSLDSPIASVTITVVADTAPPTVSLTKPALRASVSGNVRVEATAADDTRVARVDFFVDGASLGAAASTPYAVTWDTTRWTKGAHLLTARAYDLAGNSTTSTARAVTVLDVTSPTVAIASPTNGSSVRSRSVVTIAVTAADLNGVTKVEFSVSGLKVCTDTTSPYTCAWTVPSGSGKTYVLVAKAFDASANVGTSTTVTVTSN